MFHSEWLTTMLSEFTASALLLIAGFYFGRWRERRRLRGKPLHEYAFIEGGEVTGRALEMGTTTLLVDLMRRMNQNQDKLNYELKIGARRFKCTTVPIVRKEYGVVGAICINIDLNYIDDYVLTSAERTAEFFRHYAHADLKLEENILSKDEYRQAQAGKRHFRDSAPRAP